MCKYYLVSVCPHDFFPNTKYDMKPCRRRHDDFFKTQFDNDQSTDKIYDHQDFLDETLKIFEDQISRVDSKVKKIKHKHENKLYRGEISQEFQEKVDLIDLEIKRLIREGETLAEKGDIPQMELRMDEVEKRLADKDAILSIAENPMLAEKQMKLCEVCGAMQAINDMEKRNLSHLDGKLHVGFAKLRNEVSNMKKQYESVLLEIEVIKEKKRRKRAERHGYGGSRDGEGSREQRRQRKKKGKRKKKKIRKRRRHGSSSSRDR